jgi:hypothetical protein
LHVYNAGIARKKFVKGRSYGRREDIEESGKGGGELTTYLMEGSQGRQKAGVNAVHLQDDASPEALTVSPAGSPM